MYIIVLKIIQQQKNILKIIKIYENVPNVKAGSKEIPKVAIFLDVVIFGVNMNSVGFAAKNMILLIIEILFLCALVYLIVIIK